MKSWFFKEQNLDLVSEALDIAEDRTGNYYKFSLGQWKRHRYDIKTQKSLRDNEITKFAFAKLNKYTGPANGYEFKTKNRDFYFICLQDRQILKALERDKNLLLLPLLVYIFTHELVHIVRFCDFSQRFDLDFEGRLIEEGVVHSKTYDILKSLSLPRLDYILDSYSYHRICDVAGV